MTYGYIRVSTDKQTVENQRFEIERFCGKCGIKIDGWIEEAVSGATSYSKRRLGRLLKKVKCGDMIVCSEISRLGRSLFMIMEILNVCMEKGCRVWTVKDGYKLGDDIQSKVLAFAFGLSAEIERKLISQRTKEALARKRSEGVALGRPRGAKTGRDNYKLASARKRIIALYANGTSIYKIAKRYKVSYNTVKSLLQRENVLPSA